MGPLDSPDASGIIAFTRHASAQHCPAAEGASNMANIPSCRTEPSRSRRGVEAVAAGRGEWNRKWVAHLYRRAAFGPTPAEIHKACQPRISEDARPAHGRRAGRGRAGWNSHRDRPSTTHEPRQPSRVVAVRHARGRPPAPREADAVLAQPLRHQQRQGPHDEADVRAERHPPQARPRQVPPVPARHEQGPGHARLARLEPAT